MTISWEYPHNYIQLISLEAEILGLGMEQSRVNLRGSTKVRGPNQTLHPSNTNMVKSLMCCFVVDLSVWARETRTGCRNSSEDTSMNLNLIFFFTRDIAWWLGTRKACTRRLLTEETHLEDPLWNGLYVQSHWEKLLFFHVIWGIPWTSLWVFSSSSSNILWKKLKMKSK